jgi:hypothetical protein
VHFDTLKFLRPTNSLIYTYKMLKHTVKLSRAAPTCFGPIGPSSGSYRWTLPNLHLCGDNQLNYVVIVQQCCSKLFPAVVGTVCRGVYCVLWCLLCAVVCTVCCGGYCVLWWVLCAVLCTVCCGVYCVLWCVLCAVVCTVCRSVCHK